jgi:CHASE2 domain-containing sensor protein
MSRDDITIIILLIGEASGVFAGFCPSWFTVSSPFFHAQAAKEGNIKRIRWGEIAATLIVVSTGVAVSWRSKSKLPLYASLAICGIFIAGYEYMIAHPSTEG